MSKIKEGDWVKTKDLGDRPVKVVAVNGALVKVKRGSKYLFYEESEVEKLNNG
jgi:hypothetical protein